MKPEKVVEFLSTVGIANANRHKRTGYVISACPLGPWNHSEGKSSPEVFGVKIESGDPHCSCFACGYHGTLGALVQRMVGLNKLSPRIEAKWAHANQLVWEAEETQEFDFDIPGIEEVLAAKKEGLHAFPEWWLGGFPGAWEVGWARAYLNTRNVSKAVCDALDVRCDPNEQRLCFPVRDFAGELRGLHGRAVDESVEPRYRMYTHGKKNNPVVWLGESWIDLTKPIVVVEGPFDLAQRLPGISQRLYAAVRHAVFREDQAHERRAGVDHAVRPRRGRQCWARAGDRSPERRPRSLSPASAEGP